MSISLMKICFPLICPINMRMFILQGAKPFYPNKILEGLRGMALSLQLSNTELVPGLKKYFVYFLHFCQSTPQSILSWLNIFALQGDSCRSKNVAKMRWLEINQRLLLHSSFKYAGPLWNQTHYKTTFSSQNTSQGDCTEDSEANVIWRCSQSTPSR